MYNNEDEPRQEEKKEFNMKSGSGKMGFKSEKGNLFIDGSRKAVPRMSHKMSKESEINGENKNKNKEDVNNRLIMLKDTLNSRGKSDFGSIVQRNSMKIKPTPSNVS